MLSSNRIAPSRVRGNASISHLGELKPGEESGWAQFGRGLDGKPPPSPTLFDVAPADNVDSDETVWVDLRGVRMERLRAFGEVWLALGVWRLLELDVLLASSCPKAAKTCLGPTVAAILAIARFCQPQSELQSRRRGIAARPSTIFWACRADKVHTDRLYAGMDQLLPHKEAIEKHLRSRVGELFAPSQELLTL